MKNAALLKYYTVLETSPINRFPKNIAISLTHNAEHRSSPRKKITEYYLGDHL